MFAIVIIFIVIPLSLFLLRLYIKGFGTCRIKHEMDNKLVIITGASSGLGEYSAHDLLLHGAQVVYACRNKDNALQAINKVPEQYLKNASFIHLDLCSFKSIKTFVETIKNEYQDIDILMNNAGALPLNFILTDDNLESFVQGNHLGPMLLTLLLLEKFNKTNGRVINLSSGGHYFGELNENSIDILSNPERILEKYYKGNKTFELYCATKLMNIYFTQFLAEKFEKDYPHLKAVCVHPGAVNTNFARANPDEKLKLLIIKYIKPLSAFFFKTTEEGAQTQLYLSYLDHAKLSSGSFYADCFVNRISQRARNTNIRNSIINWSLRSLEAYL